MLILQEMLNKLENLEQKVLDYVELSICSLKKIEFSISATSRAPRGEEKHGVEYYFFTADEFRARIAADEFVEYEEVYENCFYGYPRLCCSYFGKTFKH